MSNESNSINRESWLELAIEELRPYFSEKNYTLPDKIRVACGFPSTKALSDKGKRLGECWGTCHSVDGIHQIFITPLLSAKLDVLNVLTHELIHSTLPDKEGHKKGFKTAAESIGYEAGSVGRVPAEALNIRLNALNLPDYPHVKLLPVTVEKKQTTRMLKLSCNNAEHEEPIILRGTKKVLEQGEFSCFCGEVFTIEKKEE